MQSCFACGSRILNVNLPCPKCGYKFDADDNLICPNRNVAVCELTGETCTVTGLDYSKCPVKNEADKEADY